MIWKSRPRTRIALLWLLACLPTGTARAQKQPVSGEILAAVSGSSTGPHEFGLVGNVLLALPASSFVPRDSNMGWAYSTEGYISKTSGSAGDTFWATVTIPTGAQLTQLGLFHDDTDPDYNITAVLRRYEGSNNGDYGSSDITSVSSSGFSGKGYAFAGGLDHTVDNDARANGGQYTVVINVSDPSPGPSLKFKGAEIFWLRQISPAPDTAAFADVPTSHAFFQYVEALAASAITAGCGNGNFCPDAALTRGQMAVFLAKALGLHWYY